MNSAPLLPATLRNGRATPMDELQQSRSRLITETHLDEPESEGVLVGDHRPVAGGGFRGGPGAPSARVYGLRAVAGRASPHSPHPAPINPASRLVRKALQHLIRTFLPCCL